MDYVTYEGLIAFTMLIITIISTVVKIVIELIKKINRQPSKARLIFFS